MGGGKLITLLYVFYSIELNLQMISYILISLELHSSYVRWAEQVLPTVP